ncbi:Uncharacterised protein [Mycobacteroides abscessus subsp. massiliense]|nr:Uncharacterised protein [Mycobacteroides abscessus subsp. massiliense]
MIEELTTDGLLDSGRSDYRAEGHADDFLYNSYGDLSYLLSDAGNDLGGCASESHRPLHYSQRTG